MTKLASTLPKALEGHPAGLHRVHRRPTDRTASERRMTARRCKDCPTDTPARPAPHPGPRCATHHRAHRRAVAAAKSDRNLTLKYGLTPADYDTLLKAQDGRCAICGRRIGVTRRAAVDHDHNCPHCDGAGCRLCVRGLVDNLCNKDVLGRFGDDPERFDAIANYLRHPPAQLILAAL